MNQADQPPPVDPFTTNSPAAPTPEGSGVPAAPAAAPQTATPPSPPVATPQPTHYQRALARGVHITNEFIMWRQHGKQQHAPLCTFDEAARQALREGKVVRSPPWNCDAFPAGKKRINIRNTAD